MPKLFSLVAVYRKLILIATLGFLLTACESSTSGAAVSAATKQDSIAIDYQKHTLDNGLTVILHQDKSDPVVHVDVTYHVGSAREEIAKSGFAHLFEHMMFQGSENVADEEHIKFVTEAGGTMNGTTNRDRTNYFETVPSNHLETMLWLEADRMGFFLEGITQEKFEIQRATVINEKQQNYDNRPYGQIWEKITKALYPSGHPYSWLTIGDLEDLEGATAGDLQDFFLRWYGPNNATLTIGGDFEANEVLKLVDKYFGGIARGKDVAKMPAQPAQLDADRYVSYYDNNVHFPAVTISFPTVPMFHPDQPALDCLATILGQGKSSYLYQSLVTSQKAIQASANHSSDELAGEFFMFVLPYPGKSLSDFEQQLRANLSAFEANGISDDDLQKYKAQFESSFINGLQKVSGKASQLAFFETFAGDAGKLNEHLKTHLAVTKADVMRVYDQYIKNRPSVVVSVLASPDQAPAKPDNFTPKKAVPVEDSAREKLVYTKAKDNFDRSVKPTSGKATIVSPPEYWQGKLSNNIRVIGSESNELPLIVFQINLKGGSILDSLNPERVGLSYMAAEMLNGSTLNFSEKAMAEQLDKLGSSVYIEASAQHFEITVSTLSKNFDKTLALLEEKFNNPAFDPSEFERLKTEAIESAKSSVRSAGAIAGSVYDKLLYGDEHIFGTTEIDTIPSLTAITLDEVKAFYKAHFSATDAEVVVVGDIDQKTFMQGLGFLENYQNGNNKSIANITLPETPDYDKATLFLVDKPDAAQSEIRIGYLGDLSYDATGEYYKRSVMNFTLGGAFNSRINLNLREDKGITYGARTWFSSSEIPGPFTASTSVKKEGTALAVSEIMKEITTFVNAPINDNELSFLKQAIGQQDALKYESNQQKAGILANILRFDIPRGYTDQQKQIIADIDASDILDLAKAHLPLSEMIILVVGDAKAIEQELQALEYPIVKLGVEGKPL